VERLFMTAEQLSVPATDEAPASAGARADAKCGAAPPVAAAGGDEAGGAPDDAGAAPGGMKDNAGSETTAGPDAGSHGKSESGDSEASRGSSESQAPREKAEEPPPKRRRQLVPFSLAALEAEVEALRADCPDYVRDIGRLSVPKVVCNDDGKVVPTEEATGPWDFTAFVIGDDFDESYGAWFRVRLRFDVDLWPNHLPLVRFQCIFHHALIDDSNGMMMPFYRALPREESGVCSVRLTLRAIHEFLIDPLGTFKLAADTSVAKLLPTINAHKKQNAERLDVIKKYATRLKHPEFFASPFQFRDDWFDPDFLRATRENTPEAWRSILQVVLKDEVFSFRMFTDAFCKKFVEEVMNFYGTGLPARRPNSMNNYGVILGDIGFEPMIDRLQEMLQPLGELLYPGGAGEVWDGHHSFIVRYRAGEDLGLDMHTDDSDVTFNVCLGIDFSGAKLQMCGLMGAPEHRKQTCTYSHVIGSCLVHLGRKRHGADDVESGERLNIILWNQSSTYRQSDEFTSVAYHREVGPPDAICVSYTHDRDYGNFREYPAGKEHMRGRGWCPRPNFEYPGFKIDCSKEICCDCGCESP